MTTKKIIDKMVKERSIAFAALNGDEDARMYMWKNHSVSRHECPNFICGINTALRIISQELIGG